MARMGERLAAQGAGAIAVEPRPGLSAPRTTTVAMGALLAALLGALALATHPFTSTSQAPRVGVRRQPSQTAVLMPGALASAASARIGASESDFWATREGAALTMRGGGIRTTFTAAGANLRTARGTLALSLLNAGSGSLAAVAPAAAANRASYRYGAVRELYENGPYGLEQSFTITRPQSTSPTLALALGIGGPLTTRASGTRSSSRPPPVRPRSATAGCAPSTRTAGSCRLT